MGCGWGCWDCSLQREREESSWHGMRRHTHGVVHPRHGTIRYYGMRLFQLLLVPPFVTGVFPLLALEVIDHPRVEALLLLLLLHHLEPLLHRASRRVTVLCLLPGVCCRDRGDTPWDLSRQAAREDTRSRAVLDTFHHEPQRVAPSVLFGLQEQLIAVNRRAVVYSRLALLTLEREEVVLGVEEAVVFDVAPNLAHTLLFLLRGNVPRPDAPRRRLLEAALERVDEVAHTFAVLAAAVPRLALLLSLLLSELLDVR